MLQGPIHFGPTVQWAAMLLFLPPLIRYLLLKAAPLDLFGACKGVDGGTRVLWCLIGLFQHLTLFESGDGVFMAVLRISSHLVWYLEDNTSIIIKTGDTSTFTQKM